jgi:hypothetical protein
MKGYRDTARIPKGYSSPLGDTGILAGYSRDTGTRDTGIQPLISIRGVVSQLKKGTAS